MSAPVYLLDPGALDGAARGTTLTLDGDEGRHATTVRRTRAGERLDLADGAGGVARCVVLEVGRGSLRARVDRLDRVPVRLPRLVLVQALAKGGRDEQAVETATELGADAVVPWQARRSVSVWVGERAERGRRRWEATARAAAKQSRRADLPVVEPLVDTAGLTALVGAAGTAALVLHEDADLPLAVALERLRGDVEGPAAGAMPGRLLVVVGPEGGIDPEELAALVAAGGHVVRLGPQVLRTSSAGPAALAVLSQATGRWDA